MAEQKNPILSIIADLDKVKAKADKTLTSPEHSNINLMIGSSLDQLAGRLHFHAGSIPTNTQAASFPPITSFLGEEIGFAPELTAADLNPDEEDTRILVEKVNNLYKQFDTLSPEGIINGYTIPEDKLIVLGVAKKAEVGGWEEFANKDFTIKFIESISQAIKDKAAAEKEQAEIDAKLEADEAKD